MNEKLKKKLRKLHKSIDIPWDELDLSKGCGFCRVEEQENGEYWEMYSSHGVDENLERYFALLKEVFHHEDFEVRFSYFYYSTFFFMVTGMHMFEIPDKLLTSDYLEEKAKEKHRCHAVKTPAKSKEAMIAAVFGLPHIEGRPVMYSQDIPLKTDESLLDTYNSIEEFDSIVKNLCEEIGHPDEFDLYHEFLRSILTSFLFEDESESLMAAIEAYLPHLYSVISMQQEDYIWQQIQFEESDRGRTEEALAWNDFVVKKAKDETFSQYIKNLYEILKNMNDDTLALTCGFGKSALETEFTIPLYRHFFNSKHLKNVSILCEKYRGEDEKAEKLYQFIEERWNSPLSPAHVKNNQWRDMEISHRILSLCQERFPVDG